MKLKIVILFINYILLIILIILLFNYYLINTIEFYFLKHFLFDRLVGNLKNAYEQFSKNNYLKY